MRLLVVGRLNGQLSTAVKMAMSAGAKVSHVDSIAQATHALRAGQYDTWLRQLVTEWGGPACIETFAPSLAGDAQARAWWAGLLRAASSPGAIKGVLEALRDTRRE